VCVCVCVCVCILTVKMWNKLFRRGTSFFYNKAKGLVKRVMTGHSICSQVIPYDNETTTVTE